MPSSAATGNASCTILCDCEAGLDRYVGPGGDESFPTPDGRPGAIVQFHVPRFRKDRVEALERSLLVRISQNVLTCPTAACFNLLDDRPYYKLGRKIAYFGDGYQFRDERHGRRVWVVPILGGEFVIDRRFGYRDGLMGGNLWFFGSDVGCRPRRGRARRARRSQSMPGVIMPFPGGIAASGSKAGSKYKFTVASTYEEYCPTLRDKLGETSRAAGGRRLGDGDHHQRPRSRTDRRRHPGRDRGVGGHAGPGAHLRRATTAAGWARASSTCTRTSSRRPADPAIS